MITQAGKKRIGKFVADAKALLSNAVRDHLEQYYGIWSGGRIISVHDLPTKNTDIIHTARLLRQRQEHIKSTLPQGKADLDAIAVGQLIAEQAFTILNRFCTLRMAEERGLIQPAVKGGYQSEGFEVYQTVAAAMGTGSTFEHYSWYIHSLFDELSVELPAVFNRYSPYGLLWLDETTLLKFLELLNDTELSDYYDATTGTVTNFWKEDETLGWIFQDYNSLEERRQMRNESTKPRNSREMAVRNQFFTPEYVVRFLTDNSLGRIWWEMTGGKSEAIEAQCEYLLHRPGETFEPRELKEPTEILWLDPTCGSMHFGLYAFSVFQTIYMDAWDNHTELLKDFHYRMGRSEFEKLVPKLILENNLYGVEIDPRALQIAAVSLWLRAQKAFSELDIEPKDRPLITKSNLVLAEPMPGNTRLLRQLTESVDKPMQKLLLKVWDKMKMAGEAGLLLKMEKEIEDEIDELRQNWSKVFKLQESGLFDTEAEKERTESENRRIRSLLRAEAKKEFFETVVERLEATIRDVASRMSNAEGYENALFTEDAIRGFAFIKMCYRKFDVIVMNPPFGEGSESTSPYLDKNYPAWCKNLVCAFFDRMQEMLTREGRLGAIFDRTVMIKSSYEEFRKRNLCGYISSCADTGWGVLDASVETSTLVVDKNSSEKEGVFMDVLDIDSQEKPDQLHALITAFNDAESTKWTHIVKSKDFANLPNSIIGYYFDENVVKIFRNLKLEERDLIARKGNDFVSFKHPRLFYELVSPVLFSHFYNGGAFSQFYTSYRDCVYWNEEVIRADSGTNLRNMQTQKKAGTGFGKRGEILDAHILKEGFYYSAEGLALPDLNRLNSVISLSFLNSILSQYTINLYCAQHKGNGYVNLLPMPDYESKQDEIEQIVNKIIEIKRYWFSLDETNLEYRGLINRMGINLDLEEAIERIQSNLTADYERYQELVRQNDDLWMDLAGIERDSEFRATLNAYKERRPYEELLSIDGASSKNIIDPSVIAKEIVQELVGMAFGRWDMRYVMDAAETPSFGDVFDALPFMPLVTLETTNLLEYFIGLPMDGIMAGGDEPRNLTDAVRRVISKIWHVNAARIEDELCHLIGVDDLHEYIDNPNGFFDYHFKRYTKSRRKAPIYWPLSTENGEFTQWVYYPRLSEDTIPAVLLRVNNALTQAMAERQAAAAAHDVSKENNIQVKINALKGMQQTLSGIIDMPYKPNHDDGVPVTAAPLAPLFRNRTWRAECESNLSKLMDGEYDWSRLAYAVNPSRIREKAKKDWCMALTHGLEAICENKPKEKKIRKKKDATEEKNLFD